MVYFTPPYSDYSKEQMRGAGNDVYVLSKGHAGLMDLISTPLLLVL